MGTAQGTVELKNDLDWFKFDAFEGNQIEINVSLDSLADSYLTLYGTDGTSLLAVNDDGGAGLASRLQWTVPTTGEYFAEVRGFDLRNTGSYELGILGIVAPDDHGNDAVSATPAGMGRTVTGEIEIGTDSDWFGFQAFAGDVVELTTSLGTLDDTVVGLRDVDGSLLAENDDTLDGRSSLLRYRIPADGTYYAVVGSYSIRKGTYELTLDTIPDDHGNSAADATVFVANGSILGEIEFQDDEDWFQIYVTEGNSIELSTTLGSLDDTLLWLFGTDGVTLLSENDNAGDSGSSRIDFNAVESGNYYVAVRGFSSETGSYELNVTGTSPPIQAAPDRYATQVDMVLADPALNVLDNDTGAGLSASLSQPPTFGSVSLLNDGTFEYTPDVGFIGTDSFHYLALDGAGNSSEAVVEIDVEALEIQPTTLPDSFTTRRDSSLNSSTGVLENDTDAVLATLVSDVSNGELMFSEDGTFSYVPDTLFVGIDQFSYFALGPTGVASEPTLVTIEVTRTATGGNGGGDMCDPNTQGDLDGDGTVAFTDFLILSQNFGHAASDHTAGDINCNGSVDFADFLVLSSNFGNSIG